MVAADEDRELAVSPRKRSLFRRRLPTIPQSAPTTPEQPGPRAASNRTPDPASPIVGGTDAAATPSPGTRSLKSLFRRRLPRTPPGTPPEKVDGAADETSPAKEIRRLQDRVKSALARLTNLKERRAQSEPAAAEPHAKADQSPLKRVHLGPGISAQGSDQDLLGLREALALLTAQVGALPPSPTRNGSRRRKLPTPTTSTPGSPAARTPSPPADEASTAHPDGRQEQKEFQPPERSNPGNAAPPELHTDMFLSPSQQLSVGSAAAPLRRNSSDLDIAHEAEKPVANDNALEVFDKGTKETTPRFGPDLAELRGYGTGRTTAPSHRQYGCRCCNCRYLLSGGRSMYPRGRASHNTVDDKMAVRPWADAGDAAAP